MADRENATPTQLAEEIFKVVGDTDSDTAKTALEIARLLLIHRELARITFEHRCSTEAFEQRIPYEPPP
jgi:hypothetical protein